jgi:hypothetical protein
MTDNEAEPFYTRGSGQVVPLSTMATSHLKSALAKLAREWPGHPEIGPMAAEVERRDAEYRAEHPEETDR